MTDEDLIRIAKKFMKDKKTCIAYNWADREISLDTIDEIREELRSAVKDELGKDYLLIFDDMKFHPGNMGKLWEIK